MGAPEHSGILVETTGERYLGAPARPIRTFTSRCLLVEPPAVPAGCSLQHVRCTFALGSAPGLSGEAPSWQRVLLQLQVLVVSGQHVMATHTIAEVLSQQQQLDDDRILLLLRVPISNSSIGVTHICLAPTALSHATSSSSSSAESMQQTINISQAGQLLVVPSSAAAVEASALLDAMAHELSALQQPSRHQGGSNTAAGDLSSTRSTSSSSQQLGASPIHTAQEVLAAGQLALQQRHHSCAECDTDTQCAACDSGCTSSTKEDRRAGASSMRRPPAPTPQLAAISTVSHSPRAAAGHGPTAAVALPPSASADMSGRYGAWLAAEQRRAGVLRQAWQGHMKAMLLDLSTALGAVTCTSADGDLLLPLAFKTRRKTTGAVCRTNPSLSNLSCGTAQQRPALCFTSSSSTTATTAVSSSSSCGGGSGRTRRRESSNNRGASCQQADPGTQGAVLQRLLSFLSGRGHWCLYGWLLSTSVRTGALTPSQLTAQAGLVHSLGAAEAAAAVPTPAPSAPVPAASRCWLPTQPGYALVLESLPPHMGLLAEEGACPDLLGDP